MRTRLLLSLLVAGAAFAAAPALGKDAVCQFQARGLSLNFGALDPSSGLNATAVLSAASLGADKAGDCQQTTMKIEADNGARLLRSATGPDVIPYALVGLPINVAAPGNNKYATFSFNGLILYSSYATVAEGTYTDTVIISVTP
jgi:hypothetical protein